jgi:hypothetical protein
VMPNIVSGNTNAPAVSYFFTISFWLEIINYYFLYFIKKKRLWLERKRRIWLKSLGHGKRRKIWKAP